VRIFAAGSPLSETTCNPDKTPRKLQLWQILRGSLTGKSKWNFPCIPAVMPRTASLPSGTPVPPGLRVVDDHKPGIRRLRKKGAFVYADPKGQPLRSVAVLRRIRSLVIPPAWENVWICPRPEGHIQATGRDARGRKQYRYHAEWTVCREEEKRQRLMALAAALPRIRRRVRRELNAPGLKRDKVLALMVRLLELTSIRAGHQEYAVQNGSFGLASMNDRHAVINGSRLEFRFTGKGGKKHVIGVDDPFLARLVEHCRRLPGRTLFQYKDDSGLPHRLRASDLNAWLKEVSGNDITAKDLRTWSATSMAFSLLRRSPPFRSATEAKRNIQAVVRRVAEQLGNTPAICRKSYIHDAVLNAYSQMTPFPGGNSSIRGLNRNEQALLALLRRNTPASTPGARAA
jgi:DNA topoisomerase-1